MPTAETDKFIRTLLTLHAYAPEKPLPEVVEAAKEMMGLTSRKERKTRLRKADPQQGAA